MAKFSGKIGFITTMESQPGCWIPTTIERKYFGDITRNISRYQSNSHVNDDIVINNIISIVADPYANENFQYMKYIIWKGIKWKIINIEYQYPRILLNVGGVYND